MVTLDQLDQLVLHILMHTARGKDRNGRPKMISTYGVCALLSRDVAEYFIAQGGIGGKGGTRIPGQPTFTQVVQYSLKRLMSRGLARHFYADTTAMCFDIHGRSIEPSYEVMALYQHVSRGSTTSCEDAASIAA